MDTIKHEPELYVPFDDKEISTLRKFRRYSIDISEGKRGLGLKWNFINDSPDTAKKLHMLQNYFRNQYGKVPQLEFTVKILEKIGPNPITPKLTQDTTSIFLGIFLKVARRIMGWNFKKDWDLICVTGNLEYKNKTLELCSIEHADEKYKHIYEEITKKNKEAGFLFLYIRDDSSKATEWEKERPGINNENIIVKSFSPKNDTIFDILDYIFHDLPVLPFCYKDNFNNEYFKNFEDITRSVLKQNRTEVLPVHYKEISEKLNFYSLFINGPLNSGKSYFVAQLVRYMVWNGKFDAPIWMEMDAIPITGSKDSIKNVMQLKIGEFFGGKKRKINDLRDINNLEEFKNNNFILIIDGIGKDKAEILNQESINNFLDVMDEYCSDLHRKGSRVIITSTKKYSGIRPKNIESIPFPLQQKKIATPPVTKIKPIFSRLASTLKPIKQIPKRKRKILVGSAIAGLFLLMFSIFAFNKTSNFAWQTRFITSISWNLSTNIIPLKPGKWTYMHNHIYDNEEYFAFRVRKGKHYYIWSKHFNTSPDRDVKMSVSYSNGGEIISEIPFFRRESPFDFIANSNDIIIIKILYPNSGDYGIGFSNSSTSLDWKRPSSVSTRRLIEKHWTDGEFVSKDDKNWYSFKVKKGKQYYLWLNDSIIGNGEKTSIANISIYYSNGNTIFPLHDNFPLSRFLWNIGNGWDSPIYFMVNSSDTVFVRVENHPYSENIETYGIMYSTSNFREGWDVSSINKAEELEKNIWVEGQITEHDKESWYSFETESEAQYYIWLNNSHRGDGTKMGRAIISAYDNSGNSIFHSIGSAWNTPQTFTANTDGMVYIRVFPFLPRIFRNTSTYSILYSTNGTRPEWFPDADHSSLIENTWEPGNITITDGEDWYSFSVKEGAQYFLWTNDSFRGDSTKSLRTRVSAFYSNGESIFTSRSDTWYSPASFIANTDDMVYIRVIPDPYNQDSIGTYGIVYSTSNIRPGWVRPPNPVMLTDYQWEDGEITSENGEDWYSFDVTAGNRYYIWLNDGKQGDGSKTLNVKLNALYNDDDVFSYGAESVWNNPLSFNARTSGRVYIRVLSNLLRESTGTYGIAFSTNSIRPAWSEPSFHTLLEQNHWEDGEITNRNRENWYSFNVTRDIRYFIWLNDGLQGDGSKTSISKMSAVYRNGDSIFINRFRSWNGGHSFIADSTGSVFLKVTSDDTGTYSILYSTNRTRPGLDFPTKPTKLRNNK